MGAVTTRTLTRVPTRVEVAERMTAEEFFRLAPEGPKTELVDGVMLMHSPPLVIHERLQGFLLSLLRVYVEEHNLGEVLGSRTPVELRAEHVFEPDIIFISEERREIIGERGVFGPPDMVIEILSAGTARYDRGVKFYAYEEAGVRELWLIDPYGPAGTEFYRLGERGFVPRSPDGDGILRSVAVPGFWVDVAWLWPRGRFIPVQRALAFIAASRPS